VTKELFGPRNRVSFNLYKSTVEDEKFDHFEQIHIFFFKMMTWVAHLSAR